MSHIPSFLSQASRRPSAQAVHRLPVGTILSAALNCTATSTSAMAANRIEMIPFVPARALRIDRLSLEVTTGVASSLAKIGIYADDGAGAPGALIVGTTDLDCATTGTKSYVLPTAQVLQPGVQYWIAVHSSSTQTFRTIAAGGLAPLGINEAGGNQYSILRGTSTYGSGLPASASTASLSLTVAAMTLVGLRTS